MDERRVTDDRAARAPGPVSAPRAIERAPRGSRLVRWIAVGVLLLLIPLGYWYVSRPQSAGPATPAGTGPGAPPAVTVAHPITRDIVEWDEFTGQFNAVDYVELRARVSGYLTEIHFTDGQLVKKGDLLFVIDPRPFEADLRQAEANLERDKAQVVRYDLDLKRYTELAKKDYAPQQQYEQARANAEATAATVKGDEAAVAQARLNLEFTHIVAPIGGRIGRHEVSLGNLILGGATQSLTLLSTIVSLDPIYFLFRHERGGLSRLPAARRQRIAEIDARQFRRRLPAAHRREGLAA